MKKIYLAFFILCIPLLAYPTYFKHIGINDGLAQLSVISICQDEFGRMWFGTNEGLSVYNGDKVITHKSVSYPDLYTHSKTNTINLGGQVYSIDVDSNKNLYFRIDYSLIKYDIKTDRFSVVQEEINAVAAIDGTIWFARLDSIFTLKDTPDGRHLLYKVDGAKNITEICKTSDNTLWVGSDSGLYRINTAGETSCIIPHKDISRIYEASNGDIWIGCRMESMYRIDRQGKITEYVHDPLNSNSIASNQIRTFMEGENGEIWIGTFKGLQKLDTTTNQYTCYTQSKLPGGLTHSSIFALYKDRQGTIWVGTYYGGVNYFNPQSDIFTYYADDPGRDDCLTYGFVGNMVEDKNNNIWICTEGGGLNKLNRKTRKIQHFYADRNTNSVAHNNLKNICYDKKRHSLYIGTHTGGLSKYDIQKNRFTNYWQLYPHNNQMPSDIVHQVEVYGDSLIVMARNGLFVMDLDTESFKPMFAGLPIPTNSGLRFLIDSKGYMWFIRTSSFVRIPMNKPEETEHYYGVNGLSKHQLTALLETNTGEIFVGSLGGGLFRFDESSKAFTNFNAADGVLPSNICYNVVQTNQGNLAVMTDKGITILDPQIKNVESIDLGYKGLLISSTHNNCGLLVCKDGEIFVGGTDGLSSFYEKDIPKKEAPYDIYFSELHISNKQITPNENAGILTQVLPYTHSITLTYKQNNLIFNFASNNYVGTLNYSGYEYILEGFDKDWISTDYTNIYYTNLNPGEYTLRVREKGVNQKLMMPKEIQLAVKIKKPYYATPLAYFLYFLLTASIISIFIYYRYSKMKLAASLAAEKKEREQIEEMNQSKLRFFTNISHEFRTPLTLILSQVELLLQSSSLPPFVYNKTLKIYKHAHHMRNLISELLDFRKFDQHHVTLNVSEQDLISFMKEIYLSFYELSLSHKISYNFSSNQEEQLCLFDPVQMKKVFYNLLSNAFKYTPKKGHIDVHITEEKEGCICVKVIDSGVGIEGKDLNRVFDRFYQADNTQNERGTGIGLALTKSIVESHHGTVSVESLPGYGSIFCVCLRKGSEHFKDDKQIVITQQDQTGNIQPDTMPDPLFMEEMIENKDTLLSMSADEELPLILIVEDNEELLQVLATLFNPMFRVILARNGAEGLQQAVSEKPDLILSDVMMPTMSGTEMCLRIKSNLDTCHIPVVLLTALDSNEHNMEGLQHGADDYIGKPFNAKLLFARCNNLVRNRRLLQKKFHSHPELDFKPLVTNQLDQDFMNRIEGIINQHLDNTDFDVNQLAKEMALGRSTLFSKFKSLTGMTPNEFILNYKLKQASVLLRSRPELQISEISDLFGFSSPRYFSKCFKEQFSVSPLDYRKGQEK